MKKIISVTLCLLMFFTSVNVSAISNISVELDADKLEFDVSPVNTDGRVLVPARKIFEALGATVLWNETTKTVTSSLNNTTVVMTIDKTQMTVNKKSITLDVAPKIINDRTLVPVRAATEAFNAKVFWEEKDNTVKIFSENYLKRTENMKTYKSSKILSEKDNIKSDFSISYFEELDIQVNANDGTDFEIVSSSDDYFLLLSVRTDVYTGYESPMTDVYAKKVADGMVKAISGTLISAEISHIKEEPFIRIHYTKPGAIANVADDKTDVLVYMGIKNGVVYTITYTLSGNAPSTVLADINYIMDTLVIN